MFSQSHKVRDVPLVVGYTKDNACSRLRLAMLMQCRHHRHHLMQHVPVLVSSLLLCFIPF